MSPSMKITTATSGTTDTSDTSDTFVIHFPPVEPYERISERPNSYFHGYFVVISSMTEPEAFE